MSMGRRAALRSARRALGKLGERGRTSLVPQCVRRAVLAYVDAAREEGTAWWQIAEDVGLSQTALRRWRENGSDGAPVALLPVEVMAGEDAVAKRAQSASGVTLVSPGGYRVEGLDIEQLSALLARIGQ